MRPADEMRAMRWRVAKDRRTRRRILGKARDEHLMKFLTPFMSDVQLHACVVVDGPIQFANTMRKMFRELKQHTRVAIIKGQASNNAAAMLEIADGFSHNAVIACAWNIVTGVGWQHTLHRVSETLGPGITLPPNTTAAMVLDHLDWDWGKEEPLDPEEKIVEIESYLPEKEHAESWHGSSRVKRGTVPEIMKENRLSGSELVRQEGDKVIVRKA